MSHLDDIGTGVLVVRTTGIYCRGECSARPHPENTAVLPSVAAAEVAGYRACLRCRSDRLPVVAVSDRWGLQVAHALELICDGFLDRHPEADLAAHLGFSARHLRRLFRQTAGATPTAVASSRRAHFARLLLDDTDLSVTEIAFAAGFGSVRQMNSVVRSTFGFAPTDLRAKRASSERSTTDGGIRLRLHTRRGFRFDAYLRALDADVVPGVTAVADGHFRRAVEVCGHPGMIDVSAPGPHEIELLAHLPALEGLIDVVAACRRVFRLDHPDDGPPGAWSAFEAEVIREVRSHSARPTEALSRLVKCYGTPVPGTSELGITYAFPAPGSLPRHSSPPPSPRPGEAMAGLA